MNVGSLAIKASDEMAKVDKDMSLAFLHTYISLASMPDRERLVAFAREVIRVTSHGGPS